jgi:hypothetical protein
MGGLFVILVVSKVYLYLPSFFRLLCLIGALIQMKLFFGLYTVIYKKEIFEIRNSPLNREATTIGKIIYCIKFGCTVTGTGATFLAGGLTYDSFLIETGRDPVFIPTLARGYNLAFGVGPNKTKSFIERTDIRVVQPDKKESVIEVLEHFNKLSTEDKKDI